MSSVVFTGSRGGTFQGLMLLYNVTDEKNGQSKIANRLVLGFFSVQGENVYYKPMMRSHPRETPNMGKLNSQ
jgi:hypothetical protein